MYRIINLGRRRRRRRRSLLLLLLLFIFCLVFVKLLLFYQSVGAQRCLRFFLSVFLSCRDICSLLKFFHQKSQKRAIDTEKPIARSLALSLSERKSAARKEVRERDGISIVGVIALSLLPRRIDVVACTEKGRCCARRTPTRRHRATATKNRTSPAASPPKTGLLRHSIAKRIKRGFFGQGDVVVVVVVVVRFR